MHSVFQQTSYPFLYWIVLQALRRCHANPLLRQLHWLPVRHRINYKLAVMTYKIQSTGLPAYLSHHINPRETTRTLCSYVHLTLYCSPYHSPGLSSLSVPSDAQIHRSGTHYLHYHQQRLSDDFQISSENFTFSVYLLTVAYTSDLITFPTARLKLRPYGAI